MRVLLTRPCDVSFQTAVELSKKGIHPVISPLTQIKMFAGSLENRDQIFLITSFFAAVWLSKCFSISRFCSIYTLSKQGADILEKSGFVNVHFIPGDAQNLVRLLSMLTITKEVLYLAGKNHTEDIPSFFSRLPSQFKVLIVYEAEENAKWIIETESELKWIDAVFHYSQRHARLFIQNLLLIPKEKNRFFKHVWHMCFSEKIMEVLKSSHVENVFKLEDHKIGFML